jgi:hypothetical protein
MQHIQQAIDTLVADISKQEEELWKTKNAVNTLCAFLKRPPIYHRDSNNESVVLGSLKGDEFYGKSLTGVVRTILESRKALNQGAAKVDEIYTAMKAGGFKFETDNDDNAKRGLRISLTKNSQTFHKLPNGTYGLREWYPAVKDRTKTVKSEIKGGDDDFDMEQKENTLLENEVEEEVTAK